MKRLSAIFALAGFVYACTAFAQEKPAPAPAQPESTQVRRPAAAETLGVSSADTLSSRAAESKWTTRDYLAAAALVLSLVGFLFGFYQYRRRITLEKEKITAEEQARFDFRQRVEEQERARLVREAQEKKLAKLRAQEQHDQEKQQQKLHTAEEAYRESMRDELGSISLLGSPEIHNLPLNLIDCFVNLRISENRRTEDFPVLSEQRETLESGRDYEPDKAIDRALNTYKTRLLLIIGDPGSGKTTLLKYYALKCLDDRYQELGFAGPRLPIFLPLHDVDPEKSFAANLVEREKTRLRLHPPSEAEVATWLTEHQTLILLDGLDEVSKIDARIDMCRWIETQYRNIHKAFFVVTSRWTGYRKADGVELEIKHLRMDVRDFSQEQQKEFLNKWFGVVYLGEDLPDGGPDDAWRTQRLMQAETKAKAIIDYLGRKENKSLQQLAVIPMLLQIMAIIWKEQEYLPRSRADLYNAALNYLLDHRDRQRKLYPILSAPDARSVLSPAALWMQEDLHAEEVEKEKLHERLQPGLDEMKEQPRAKAFCENLRDRAGVIADYGKNDYIFRHKSFREYLAGMQLAELFHEEGRLQRLVKVFGDDWWEEPLRFFVSKPNGKLFDSFMKTLFRSERSRDLSDKQQDVLRLLVQEAGQRKIDALVECLNDPAATESQRRYILDCLQTIGTDQALQAIAAFAQQIAGESQTRDRARQILRERMPETALPGEEIPARFQFGQKIFHNPLEYNAEYLLIPGGAFRYSLTKRVEKVPDLYFAKYPVTNKRYRRFIRYLRAEERELIEQVPLKIFGEKLLDFAGGIEGYRAYLGSEIDAWADKLKPRYDDDRKFNGADQPVVGVSWFAARAYCFWLSVFAEPGMQETMNNPDSAAATATVYRLPHEIEWERAAAGLDHEKDAPREYPWGKDTPNEKLANYNRNVGATTPVDRYPAGATPEGLMDMAGNVWEWQENWYDEREKVERALRGGSWGISAEYLRCSARYLLNPGYGYNHYGFRLVRSQSVFDTL